MSLRHLRVRTPAKINTVLQILHRRDDGFHEIFTHLVPINCYDILTFQEHPLQRFSFRCSDESLEGPDNLVWQALQAFEEASGRTVRLSIHLQKIIPYGAGLGGGSGNAAGTLLALNHWFGHPLATEELEELARELGSDVPFFLNPQPSLGTGRGEQLQPLADFPAAEVLLAIPPFPSSTALAYQNCKPKRRAPVPPPHNFEELSKQVDNQFNETLFARHPQLQDLCLALLGQGAATASVSGSGSAVFGLFADYEERDQALFALHGYLDAQLIPCRLLQNHIYFEGEDPRAC